MITELKDCCSCTNISNTGELANFFNCVYHHPHILFTAKLLLNLQCSKWSRKVHDIEELTLHTFQLVHDCVHFVMEKDITEMLKDSSLISCTTVHVCLIVVDESHTVEMWTGKR